MRVLLIEDHGRLSSSIAKGLARFGFSVHAFLTAGEGLNAFKSTAYDAIVLDLGLPDRDGLELLRDLREYNLSTPILILTARDGIDDRVTGLDAGADDYVVKPFAMKELAARLRALLRRPGRAFGGVLTVGNLQLRTDSREVRVAGKTVHFPPREVDALELLMRRAGQIVSKRNLEDSLYGRNTHVSPNWIDVLVSRLRRRIGDIGAGCSLHTFYGIGYLLKDDLT